MTQPGKPVLGMILKGYPRISETFISNEILLLEEMGFSVRIFSMRRPREAFTHDSVRRIRAGVDYLPETLLAPMPRFLKHNFGCFLHDPARYRAALRHALVRFSRTHKSATFKHLLQAGYLVHKLLPESGVTHLHAHFAHSPTSVAMFASMLSGLPFSFTAHAKDIYTQDPRQLSEKLRMAKFVVTCTEYNRRHLAALAEGAGDRVFRFYHGIDTRLFDGPADRPPPAPPYRLFTVARMAPKKGLPTVLKAVRALLDRGLDVRYTLIGTGDDEKKIRALIRELRLESVTRLLGTRPHDVVIDEFRKADLFLLGCEVAGNGDRDGIPNVFLESMAMGVPVVATTVSAIPELVEDGVTGLAVPPGEPGRMADAAQRLLTDGALRERVVAKGRERVAEGFDNRRLIRGLADVYRTRAGLVPDR